jgi:acetolactate synthase small subunit
MSQTHRFQLTVGEDRSVLERVVSACRSRQCTILSLQFSKGDRHRPGQLLLTLEGDPKHARLAAERLERLVDVLDVDATAYSQPRSVASSTAWARSTAPSLP